MIRDNQFTRLKGQGSRVPIGVLPENTYEETTMQLEADDLLLFFTDGIIEARNGSGFYGYESLLAFVKSMDRSVSALKIRDAIIRDIEKHVGSHHQHDDITLIVIKVR